MSNPSVLPDRICAQRGRTKVTLAFLIAPGCSARSATVVGPGDRASSVLVAAVFVPFSGTFRYCTKRAMEG